MDSLTGGYYSLEEDINKAKGKEDEAREGISSDLLPELALDMGDEELVKLIEKSERSWSTSSIYGQWVKAITENEKYWKGHQFSTVELDTLRPLVDNIIFEAVETFLPAATRQNPEPLVEVRATDPANEPNTKYTEIVRDRLADWADDIRIRLKLKKVARHWLIYLLGVGKMSFDDETKMPCLKIIRPQKLILDIDGITDEEGYSGKFIGEFRRMEAGELMEQAEQNVDYIKEKIQGDKGQGDTGTKIQFIEFWTKDFYCWKLDDKILLKKKNPHWNYGKEGMEAKQNHFVMREMPYIMLSIFNLGKSPVDETSLISQSLSDQDLINKRLKQIDKNADGMNNGLVVSEERSGLTKEEAKGVTEALRRGGIVTIPSGSPTDAVARFPAIPLPSDIFNQAIDSRNRLRDRFGITGITPAGLKNEDTVRGKIMVRGLNTDRIGGGITEYLEQFADKVYNWTLQLFYVYDDIFQPIANGQAKPPRVKISVKEGSLLPKDATTIANQAIELAGAGKMSLIDLYKRLEFPDPEEMAANLWLEANAPELLFPDNKLVQQAVQMKQQAAQQQAQAEAQKGKKGVSESMSFKDLPPDGKEQMAAQAGITLTAEGIATHDANQAQQESATQIEQDTQRSLLKQVPIKGQ